jgi:selenide, water dikinase
VLRHLTPPEHPDLLVGTDTSDDAAVWRRSDGRALVATADFFTPIVDDARTWGRIAAANAVSDVYAMGATPLFGLNLVAWPNNQLPLDLLGEVLAGGADAAIEGEWIVAGGHTVDGPEPMYGMSMMGEVEEADLLPNAGGRAGQVLVLTKPIGTGLLATAVKRNEPTAVAVGGDLHECYVAGVREMSRLNNRAAEAAAAAKATGATDVTGFGLLGHLHEMCKGSGLSAVVHADLVPLLPNAVDLLDSGFVAGGSQRNLDHLASIISGGDGRTNLMLADAQTSGGLLFSCDQAQAERAVTRLRDQGHDAAIIGSLHPADPDTLGTIRVEGALAAPRR